MSVKSSNVMVRVEPEIKEQAEEVMSHLGLSASTAINLFYRQMIVEQALPFRPSTNYGNHQKAISEMSKEEFDQRMAIGYTQAIRGKVRPAENVFDDLLKELENV